MSTYNPLTTPSHQQQSHRPSLVTTITSPKAIKVSSIVGQGKMKQYSGSSTDRSLPVSVSISVPGPAPPANLSRLQPHNHSQHNTSTSGNTTNKGLKPLGMTSSSTLNIPPRSPSSSSHDFKHPLSPNPDSITTNKLEKRPSIILPHSTPTIKDTEEPDSQMQSGSRNKLKRLSLCARPPSLELDSNDSRPASSILASPSPNLQSQPSTPISGSTQPRRPDRRMGVRASISYSPAIPASTPRTAERKVFGRGDGWGMEEDLLDRMDQHKRDFVSEDEAADDAQQIGRTNGVQTLAEKHADLLTHIAQRERRVAELKQELLAQENSLAQLKSRWTTIVSRSALSPIQSQSHSDQTASTSSSTPSSRSSNTHARSSTAQYPLTRRPISTISSSTSTSTSSSSMSLATIDEPLANALISTTGGLSTSGAAVLSGLISQTEGYLGPEVVQGGKRFLGNLWKTVGAAAGGTVPEQEPIIRDGMSPTDGRAGEWTPGGSKLDLANLQKLITPWDTPSSKLPDASTVTSSSSSRMANRQQQQRSTRRTTDRSNTVTPTSFSRSLGTPTSPPATVGLGFDLNIKSTSSISSRSSPSSSPTCSLSRNFLDDDDDHDVDHLPSHEDNQAEANFKQGANSGALGKALTPMKPKINTENLVNAVTSSMSSTTSTSTSDDGWGW
ncbi:uncharacterized protein I303_102364 [Kwoniella dejecticola CBS 10117]|uniref:DUF4048 domain-containing protein n=1 Tax=Kwoniella dejecticola CBS 10117 TaxID=1296121 RepID=A0A1A6AB65_9TREE|nr:uncharacterized protein I303_01496 [Kwoniella dejecticola CBS 10117]OBR87294.1 hypothetical protein I303_01496 [Kwoniella dejecticola CBS 10117]